jgi:uncharacterized membrane protein
MLCGSLLPAGAAPAAPALPGEQILVNPTRIYRGLLVADPQARSGYALAGNSDFNQPGPGAMAWDYYAYKYLPGRVRGTLRMKVADNTVKSVVVLIQSYICYGGDLKSGQSVTQFLKGTDFAAPNVYQDFPLEVSMGEQGFGVWFVGTQGGTTVTFDGLSWQQESVFSTAELLDQVNLPVKPAGLTLNAEAFTVHETHGLFMERWGVRPALGQLPAPLRAGSEWHESYLNVHPQQTALTGDKPTLMSESQIVDYEKTHPRPPALAGVKQPFPRKWEDLYRCRAVVLNNVPTKAVTIVGTLMLKAYLQDGGCVLLMGDTHGLAAGGWDQSVLAPLLPVTLTTNDRVRPAAPLVLSPRTDALRGLGLDWAAAPFTQYYHQATLKPGAQVLVAAGDVPLVVAAPVGKGRVVVFLNSVLGEKPPQTRGLPFWEWPDWPRLMAALLAGNS